MSLILIAFIFNAHTAQKWEIKLAGANDRSKTTMKRKKTSLHYVILTNWGRTAKIVRTDGSSLQLRSQHKVKRLFKTVSTRWQVFPLHYMTTNLEVTNSIIQGRQNTKSSCRGESPLVKPLKAKSGWRNDFK